MPRYVLDASVAAKWYFEEEQLRAGREATCR